MDIIKYKNEYAVIETSLTPEELLHEIKEIEEYDPNATLQEILHELENLDKLIVYDDYAYFINLDEIK